ncbi:hypothetical protein BLNAU_11141 [Blattamonas nauphoetae]|uniref:Uncharacterized protein n=1 Tax=Blattamonas nauphoetae TaxID=2049346 RepID=A0ABQ9XPB4_9EUKA|nr:hypothetical protein BLNAU_11141 [Blattamonas nauphoetae]
MFNIQRNWNGARGEERQMVMTVDRKFRMEGIEDAMETNLQKDKNGSWGKYIVVNSIRWNNLQGMNLPEPEQEPDTSAVDVEGSEDVVVQFMAVFDPIFSTHTYTLPLPSASPSPSTPSHSSLPLPHHPHPPTPLCLSLTTHTLPLPLPLLTTYTLPLPLPLSLTIHTSHSSASPSPPTPPTPSASLTTHTLPLLSASPHHPHPPTPLCLSLTIHTLPLLSASPSSHLPLPLHHPHPRPLPPHPHLPLPQSLTTHTLPLPCLSPHHPHPPTPSASLTIHTLPLLSLPLPHHPHLPLPLPLPHHPHPPTPSASPSPPTPSLLCLSPHHPHLPLPLPLLTTHTLHSLCLSLTTHTLPLLCLSSPPTPSHSPLPLPHHPHLPLPSASPSPPTLSTPSVSPSPPTLSHSPLPLPHHPHPPTPLCLSLTIHTLHSPLPLPHHPHLPLPLPLPHHPHSPTPSVSPSPPTLSHSLCLSLTTHTLPLPLPLPHHPHPPTPLCLSLTTHTLPLPSASPSPLEVIPSHFDSPLLFHLPSLAGAQRGVLQTLSSHSGIPSLSTSQNTDSDWERIFEAMTTLSSFVASKCESGEQIEWQSTEMIDGITHFFILDGIKNPSIFDDLTRMTHLAYSVVMCLEDTYCVDPAVRLTAARTENQSTNFSQFKQLVDPEIVEVRKQFNSQLFEEVGRISMWRWLLQKVADGEEVQKDTSFLKSPFFRPTLLPLQAKFQQLASSLEGSEDSSTSSLYSSHSSPDTSLEALLEVKYRRRSDFGYTQI